MVIVKDLHNVNAETTDIANALWLAVCENVYDVLLGTIGES